MKKLLAILLAVLMLCAMVPFATVAAADEPTIQISIDAEEFNAGDEFDVTINLLNIPDPGLIGAQVEIVYDHDVFELVTYFDEDEEAWFPQIEVGSKYNASTNKYIMFGPIDDETGESQNCLVQYLRATASENQVRYEEHYFTATFKVKDDAISGTYDLIADKYQGGNTVTYGNGRVGDLFTVENATVTINGTEPPACVHEYEYDCSKVCSLCGEETRPEAEHAYFYSCDPVCMNCGELTNPDANHNILHVEAKDAISCIEYGNREYWTCEDCGTAWLDEGLMIQTNLMSVRIAGECVSDAEYPCQDGTCVNCGLPVYAEEHEYFYACDQYCMNCGELTNPDATHTITHVDAVAPTCTENGNIEYWTCEACGSCWDNENGEGMPLNNRMVVIWAEGHVYDDDADLECNVCGYIREALTPIAVLGNLGTSVSEDVNGLGFGFSANVADVMVENGNEFIAGAVIPFDNGEIYNLAGVGAILSNDTDVELIMENVDDSRTKNVPALLLSDANTEDGQIEFAVRVVNIPNMVKNVTISARPYFIYTTIEGEEIVVYGDTISCSYNEAMELIPMG